MYGGEDDLLQLAADRSCRGVRKLWRASCWVMVLPPFARRPVSQVRERRRRDADRVDAAVLVEALILDRNDGLDQVRRHLLDRNLEPLLLEDGECRLVVGVEDASSPGPCRPMSLSACRSGRPAVSS